MNATDSAFFQSLLDEIRSHMPKAPTEVVESMRAIANEAFWQCTRTIEREREIKRRREKIDIERYGTAARRKNDPYDQAGATLTVLLMGRGLTQSGLWAAKVLWFSGFSTLTQEMSVVDPFSESDNAIRGKEDTAALMRWGRFESRMLGQLEDMLADLPEGDSRRAALHRSK